MIANQITPLLITHDEAPNIERILAKLLWAKRIIVVDSGSTDGTLEILARYSQIEVLSRPFTSFADQCNFGLAAVRTEWVLSLDADYELSADFVKELQHLDCAADVNGYWARFIYKIYGRPLRGTLYPPRIVLHRVRNVRYFKEGHAHRVAVPGNIGNLRSVIYHDDRKPLLRWYRSQQKYAEAEAQHLLTTNPRALSRIDRLRRSTWIVPIVAPIYVLFVRGCIIDGWAGWHYALQRLVAEGMIALSVLERRMRGFNSNG
jgi:glycosyltransferase involved in cell wall biosynthesis